MTKKGTFTIPHSAEVRITEETIELPTIHVEEVTEGETRERWLPPDFDPNDPKWEDVEYIEEIVTVGLHTESERGPVVEREEMRALVDEIRKILIPPEDWQGEKPYDAEGAIVLEPNNHDDSEAEIIDFVENIVLDEEYPKALEKPPKNEREKITRRWYSGMMNKLGTFPGSRELHAFVLAVAAAVMVERADLNESEYVESTSSSYMVPADVENEPVDAAMQIRVEDKEPDVEIAEEEFFKKTFTSDFSHASKFELDDTEVVEAKKQYADIIDGIRDGMLNAEMADAKDLEIVVKKENAGVSMRRLFDKAGTKERNEVLGKQRFEKVATPLVDALQEAFPDQSIRIDGEDQTGFTIGGEFMNTDDAEAFVRNTLHIPDGKKGDKQLYKALKAFDNGKFDKFLDKTTLTEGQKEKARLVVSDVQSERDLNIDVSLAGTRVQELVAPAMDPPPTPEPAPTPAPEPIPAPEPGYQLLDRDPAIHEVYHYTPMPGDPAGERPLPPGYSEGTIVTKRNTTQKIRTEKIKKNTVITKQRRRRIIGEPDGSEFMSGQGSQERGPMRTEHFTKGGLAERRQESERPDKKGSKKPGVFGESSGRTGRRGGGGPVKIDDDGHAKPVKGHQLPKKKPRNNV